MKLKVLKPYFDKKEDKYVYPAEAPIEREDTRAAELIAAGVAEEYVEASAPQTEPETAPADDEQAPAEPAPAKTKPKTKGKK